jgi:hypothetical protein
MGNFDIRGAEPLIFINFLPYFEKNKGGLCDHHAVCVSVPVNPPY